MFCCRYQPILFVNTYWSLIRDYSPINETSKQLNISLTFQPLSLFKWQLYAAQSAKNKWVLQTTWGIAAGVFRLVKVEGYSAELVVRKCVWEASVRVPLRMVKSSHRGRVTFVEIKGYSVGCDWQIKRCSSHVIICLRNDVGSNCDWWNDVVLWS